MSQKSKFFTTKVHKDISQRTQNIAKQIVVFVNLCGKNGIVIVRLLILLFPDFDNATPNPFHAECKTLYRYCNNLISNAKNEVMRFVPISMPRHPNRRSEFCITLIYRAFQKHRNKSVEVRKKVTNGEGFISLCNSVSSAPLCCFSPFGGTKRGLFNTETQRTQRVTESHISQSHIYSFTTFFVTTPFSVVIRRK